MDLGGVLAPIPTPFRDDVVDAVALDAAIGRWMRTLVAGLVVLGSNGEAALLDEEESDRAIAIARAAVPRDRLLIAGTGRESTKATLAATRRAAHLGVDAVLVRTPSFFRQQMTSDAFERHYTAIADASPVPVLLYNFTAVTGVDLARDAIVRLAVHPNIAGMKESNADIAKIGEIVGDVPPGFKVLAGSSSTFYAALTVGAAGGILALACVLPDACVRLFHLARLGPAEEARALQRQVVPLARLLGPVYGVAGLKAALKLVGLDVGDPRPPLGRLSLPGIEAIRAELARVPELVTELAV